jgi:hypothetical protein
LCGKRCDKMDCQKKCHEIFNGISVKAF